MRELLKDRYTIMGAVFTIFVAVIITQLVNLQVIRGKQLEDESQKRLLNNRPVIAPRGDIEDRNGAPIAVSRAGFMVQIFKAGLDDKDLNAMILKLVNVFGKNNDSYYKNLKKYLTFNPIGFGSSVSKLRDPVSGVIKELGLKPKNNDVLKTAQDIFNYLKKKQYNISSQYTDEEAYKIMTMRYEIKNYGTLNPTPLAKDVSKETVAEVEERHYEFPGISTDVEPVREYINGQDVAHAIGFIGAINEDEYKRLKGNGYGMNDLIGKDGIERSAEKYLKGTDGQRRIEVNAEGKLTEVLNSVRAIPGDKVVLTLDMNLQKIAMESLKRNIERIKNKEDITGIKTNMGDASAGSVVALDVNTGEVLAMASYPSYDPSLYPAGAEDKVAQQTKNNLNNDKTLPLINRAIGARYEPGSTFKPVMGIAGLEEGVITPKSTINDPGVINVEGVDLKCLEYVNHTKPNGHGDINLENALATSCNMYFFKLGMMLGIDKIDKWATFFGLGQYTGIDIGGESKGVLSSPAYHYSIYPKNKYNYNWGSVLTAYSSIGQLYNNYTPLQLANYTASIANGGKRYVPHLIKRVVKYDGTTVLETKPSFFQIPVKKSTIDAVKQGMVDVANSSEGTAAQVFWDFTNKYNISVAGKTGTAQSPDSEKGLCSNNGVFICYAPADKPRIAIAVVIEKGVQGRFTAPVAKDILAGYFNLNNKICIDDAARADTVNYTK